MQRSDITDNPTKLAQKLKMLAKDTQGMNDTDKQEAIKKFFNRHSELISSVLNDESITEKLNDSKWNPDEKVLLEEFSKFLGTKTNNLIIPMWKANLDREIQRLNMLNMHSHFVRATPKKTDRNQALMSDNKTSPKK